ncbi:MAG: ATP-dependent sacrificial sulfur transferase LarE [Desulfobacteraceae bacterium]|nr:ATP-dependent sacrificial sulfur transferase LarE [Desulfobacteraceae bacterium]
MTGNLILLEKKLENLSPFVIAFSGGVDSTFLAAVAKRVCPDTSIAITVASQFVASRETQFAKIMAREIGINHTCLDIDVLQFSDVTQNSSLRCYYCKKHIFSLIKQKAKSLGISNLIHAVNLDDLNDYRPGLKAAEELGYHAPLVEAGFTKQDIRVASKKMRLQTWNMPSQSCLATRIPYDDPITSNKLAMVEQGEAVLYDLGFKHTRVRCHGLLARIEVPSESIGLFLGEEIRKKITKTFQKIGFNYTSIDVDGYKTGKMNIVNTPK